MGTFGTLGGILGAGAGAAVAGPAGVAAGSALGSGIGQFFDAKKAQKKADQSTPLQTDPLQVRLMQEYERRAANARAGVGTIYANQMQNLNQMQGAGVKALGRTGNLGQYGLLSKMIANQRNDVLANAAGSELAYRQLAGTMGDKIAHRRLFLDQVRESRFRAQQALNEKGAAENINAGMAKLPSAGGGKRGAPNYASSTGAPNTIAGGGGSVETMGPTQTMPATNPIMGFGGLPLPGFGGTAGGSAGITAGEATGAGIMELAPLLLAV